MKCLMTDEREQHGKKAVEESRLLQTVMEKGEKLPGHYANKPDQDLGKNIGGEDMRKGNVHDQPEKRGAKSEIPQGALNFHFRCWEGA